MDERKYTALCAAVDDVVCAVVNNMNESLSIYATLIATEVAAAKGVSLKDKLEGCDELFDIIKERITKLHNSTEDASEQSPDIETTNPPNTNTPWAR